MLFRSFGKIAVSGKNQKPGWFYVQADEEISDYYRWFYSRAFKTWYPCMNGCHITFIAGEKDDRLVHVSEMSQYINEDIIFEYTNQIRTNGRAFWLSCYSDDLNKIRRELKLQFRPLFHITLGNIKNETKA